MAMAAPEIRVFAMFPPDPANPEPFSSWIWVNCLAFPLDTLNNLAFTPKYYKWIRYATGVVISFSQDLLHDVVEYDHELPAISVDLYYHISDAEKRRIFPADPNMAHAEITSFGTTPRRVNFRSDVAARDGERCVLTSTGAIGCNAVHLLPHSKGDEYIETYTRHRSRDPTRNDVVSDIDNIRNGVFLNTFAHTILGSDFALLMTPNFAMNTTDVDLTAPPTERRCTAHLFVLNNPMLTGSPMVGSGSQVRMPDVADEWPPDTIFDAVYAEVVLKHFAPQVMKDTLKRWKPMFYPREIMSTAQASFQRILDERAAKNDRKDKQKQEREDRAARRANREGLQMGDQVDYLDCIMLLPYLMVPPEKQEAVWRAAVEKMAEREQHRLKDKVVDWAKEVANAFS